MSKFLKQLVNFLLLSSLIFFLFSCSNSSSGGSKKDKIGDFETPPFLGKKFLGKVICKNCHSSTVKEWENTAHASAFSLIPATDPVCQRCHTTGFDTSVSNGGFDENNSKKLKNVQCESCHQAAANFGPHGPNGKEKVFKSIKFNRTLLALNSEVCGFCHTKTVAGSFSKGQFDQWENSSHSKALENIKGKPGTNQACVKCHTVESIYVKDVELASAKFGVECTACHDPHSVKNIFQLLSFGSVTLENKTTVNADIAAVCMGCHTDLIEDADVAAESGAAPRYNQSEMFSGSGGIQYGETLENSFHTTDAFKVAGNDKNEKCITCHMVKTPDEGKPGHNTIGEHSFAMRDKDDNINIGACQQCHTTLTTFDRKARGDYDGNGKTEGIQTEIAGLLAILKAAITASGSVTFSSDSFGRDEFIFSAGATSKEKKAAFNWLFVNDDKSKGIHNTAYAVQLLQKSYKDLTGTDVPGATIR